MIQPKWTDQDMTEFAQQFSEYDITAKDLEDWKEQVKHREYSARIQELVGSLTHNPELLQLMESIVNSGNNQEK